jgi:broad specificity phosphatase PhoE
MANEMGIALLAPVADLNERHYGEISGLTALEIEERYPELMKEWRVGNPVEIPGGEAWQDFVDRVFRGLRHLSTLQGCVLAIAHIGVLRAIEYRSGETKGRHTNLDGMWVDLV